MSNKSLDRSYGSDFRVERDPAKVLGSAVARSTQTFDSFLKPMKRIGFYLPIISTALCLGVFAYAIKTKQHQISPETREAEEYAVYSALINSFHPQNDASYC